jgi:hypothetical protein
MDSDAENADTSIDWQWEMSCLKDSVNGLKASIIELQKAIEANTEEIKKR